MSWITYPSFDGLKKLGTETIVTLVDEVDGANYDCKNILADPLVVGNWTTGNVATLENEGRRGLKLTNGAASGGYASMQLTVEQGSYYLFRAYAHNEDSNSCYIAFGTAAGSTAYGSAASSSDSKGFTLIVKAPAATMWATLRNNITDGAISYWSNIEVIKLEHLGVDETTDYITNGDFPTGTTGWTMYDDSGTGSISVAAGQLVVDNNSSATYTRAVQGITTDVGKAYKAIVDVIGADAGASGAQIRATNDANGGSSGLLAATNGGAGDTIECNFIATATTTYISLMCNSATTTHTATFDNCIVTESGNLVGNHNFTFDYVWTKGTGWSISGGVASHSGASNSSFYQPGFDNLIVGEYYIVGVEVSGVSGGGTLTMRTTVGAFRDNTINITANGTYYYTLQCTNIDTTYGLAFGAVNTISIDNVTLRRAVPIHSGTLTLGLEVYGEIALVPVARGSGLVAFGNFSAVNKLQMPYSSDLDAGTGDLSASLWFLNPGTSTTEYILARDSSPTGANYRMNLGSGGALNAYIDDGTTDRSRNSSAAYDDGVWHCSALVYDQSEGDVNLNVDGKYEGQATGATLNTLTNTSAVLTIGQYGGAYPFGGFICITKIDIGNAWTAAQIADIHASEAPLFTDGHPYSENGVSRGIELPVNHSNQFEDDIVNSVETLTQAKATVFWSEATGYSLRTRKLPRNGETINDFTSKDMQHFLSSVKRGASFTFDEYGEQYAPDEPVQVVLKSTNHQRTKEDGIEYYQYNIQLKQVEY